MPFSLRCVLRPVWWQVYFTRPAIHVWCKNLAHGREGVFAEEWRGHMLFRRSMQSILSYAVWPACDGIRVLVKMWKSSKVVTRWSWWRWTQKNNSNWNYNEKHQNSSYELLCLKVNGPSCNWSLWRYAPRHRHHWIRLG